MEYKLEKFAMLRRWRFELSFPHQNVGIEISEVEYEQIKIEGPTAEHYLMVQAHLRSRAEKVRERANLGNYTQLP